ncbi:HK97 gp10 family phage protein [Apilactobacillus xinyiensis]|uniref:HK97 gp10 family phage protein n=1 Tax=Apilactobacillus xinyiensis TaxID=2841032 RepID=UPI003365138E
MNLGDVESVVFEDYAKYVNDRVKAKIASKNITREVNTMSQAMLGDVIKVTNVDTGTLRRGWRSSGVKYAASTFSFSLENNVEYGFYVENGHRNKGGGWVEGSFFLKDTVLKYKKDLNSVWKQRFTEALREAIE